MQNLIKEYIYPVKIILNQGNWKNIKNLLNNNVLQVGFNDELCSAELSGPGFIVLDYGKELSGGVKIVVPNAPKNTNVRLRFGESIGEVNSEIGYKNSTNDHALRDFNIKLNTLSSNEYGHTGFRFLRIDFNLSLQETVMIKACPAAFEHRKFVEKGSFLCDDAVINKIYDTAKYTLELCMQEYLWDGIKRDRLIWVGDMHPETLGINCVFGGDKTVEESLDFAKSQAPLPQWMNGIAMYSMWWIIILYDNYLQNGDAEYLRKNFYYLRELVYLIEKHINSDGTGNYDWQFLDWQTNDTYDAVTGVNALTMISIKCAEKIFKVFSCDTKICDIIFLKLKKFKPRKINKKQIYAMRMLAGYNENYSEAITENSAQGMSTFMSYYILSALAKADKYNEALSIMKEYYSAMLDRGATTFWEDFNMNWLKNSGRIDEPLKDGMLDIHGDMGAFCYEGFRHSLCHGWSCGPIQFLTYKIAGIRIIEPGCKKVEISPNLGWLKFIKVDYPTPYGIIHIEAYNDGRLYVSAPKGIEVVY